MNEVEMGDRRICPQDRLGLIDRNRLGNRPRQYDMRQAVPAHDLRCRLPVYTIGANENLVAVLDEGGQCGFDGKRPAALHGDDAVIRTGAGQVPDPVADIGSTLTKSLIAGAEIVLHVGLNLWRKGKRPWREQARLS